MKNRSSLFSMIFLMSVILISCNQNNDNQIVNESKFSKLTGPYLGQNPPGMKPELFAPDLLTAGGDVSSITFSPDGMELCYFIWTPGGESLTEPKGPFQQMFILYSRIENGYWTEPKEFSFAHDRKQCYPFFSPDGERIYFVSWRSGQGPTMFVEKSNGELSQPQNIFLKNDPKTGFVSVAANRNLYFFNFIRYRFENGEYTLPEKLNIPESDLGCHHPFIAPDESYIIFDFPNAEDSFGEEDLYISFRDKNDNWTEPINMGEGINTMHRDKRAFVSFNGKYLFFSSNRIGESKLPGETMTLTDLKQLMHKSPVNGYENIFWVSAKVIDDLKPDHLK